MRVVPAGKLPHAVVSPHSCFIKKKKKYYHLLKAQISNFRGMSHRKARKRDICSFISGEGKTELEDLFLFVCKFYVDLKSKPGNSLE